LFQNIASENWNGTMVELKTVKSKETMLVYITDTAKELFNILMEFIDILDSIASTMVIILRFLTKDLSKSNE
jgi:predicted transcriptional regulator